MMENSVKALKVQSVQVQRKQPSQMTNKFNASVLAEASKKPQVPPPTKPNRLRLRKQQIGTSQRLPPQPKRRSSPFNPNPNTKEAETILKPDNARPSPYYAIPLSNHIKNYTNTIIPLISKKLVVMTPMLPFLFFATCPQHSPWTPFPWVNLD